jgi:hypothetical protein
MSDRRPFGQLPACLAVLLISTQSLFGSVTGFRFHQISRSRYCLEDGRSTLGVFDQGCDWEVGPPNQGTWSVLVGIIGSGGRSYYDQYFAPFEGTPITGLGDVALQRTKDEVLAVSGDVLAGVTVIAPGAHDQTLAEQLMRLVIGRV